MKCKPHATVHLFPDHASHPSMAQRPFTLSLRALSGQRTRQAQWVCSRCLATQSTPLNAPLQQHASTVNRSIEETLGTPLAHNIPIQHLQHSTSDVLHADEQAQREKAVVHKKIVGVVVSAGRMHKTVKVRVPGQDWNKKIGKVSTPYPLPAQHQASNDETALPPPNQSSRTRPQFIPGSRRRRGAPPAPSQHHCTPRRRTHHNTVRHRNRGTTSHPDAGRAISGVQRETIRETAPTRTATTSR